MHIPRLFLPQNAIDPSKGLVTIFDPATVRQLIKVLRLAPGRSIIVLDGEGLAYHCRLNTIDSTQVQASIVSQEILPSDRSPTTSVMLPLIKKDRFEWALEKLTELGVSSVVPFSSDRTVRETCSPAMLKRWQSILREASEQSERPTIPHIVEPAKLGTILAREQQPADVQSTLNLICTERLKAPTIREYLPEHLYSHRISDKPLKAILILVGPEGGFTAPELELIGCHHYQPVSLGSRILRSETAAICALSQVVSVSGT